jgi:hypothetical protein
MPTSLPSYQQQPKMNVQGHVCLRLCIVHAGADTRLAFVILSQPSTMQDAKDQDTGAGEEQQEGEIDQADVAEQMDADDFLQPQAQQPELQFPEDLDLDGAALDDQEDNAEGTEAQVPEEEEHPELMDVGGSAIISAALQCWRAQLAMRWQA